MARPRAYRGFRGVAIPIAIFLFAAAGLGWWLRPHRPERRESGLSILLITVDTLRADALGAYGNAAALTPWMDRLAAGGVRFEDAHAHNVVTLPSHANILSGRYPTDHGVRDNAGFRFPPGTETLATLLHARGYATGAFVSGFPLAARFGLSRGFDVYDDTFVEASARPAFLEQWRRGTETVALARAWLDAQGARPSLAWVHVYEPHAPYEPPEPLASRFAADPYAGDVAAADAALGPLIEPLLAKAAAGRTLVVLTADHGESLGEHGEATHGILAYEATLRVPLILYAPRLMRPGVVRAPARHVDLLPTILDALALPPVEGLPGRSLLPLAAGEVLGPVPTYFEALSGPLNRGWAPLRGVIRDGQKYIDLPLPELYDLAHDARETTNLASTRTGEVESLRAALAAWTGRDAGAPRVTEDADTRERLRSLGYVGGSGRGLDRRYTEADDPKRLMPLDAMLQDVARLYGAGDLRAAREKCLELVRLRPGMAVSQLYLAHLERESGDLPAAIDALRRALAAAPGDTVTLALLGAYLTEAGRAAEAVDVLAPAAAAAAPEVDVLTARGLGLARLGRFPEAQASFARARAVDPRNALVLVDEGTVDLMQGDRDRARASFEAALATNPGVARAHSSLGFLLAEAGAHEEALSHWKQAIALDPLESGKLVPLAMMLAQGGRAGEARGYVELFVASAPPDRFGADIERARRWLASAPPGGDGRRPTPPR